MKKTQALSLALSLPLLFASFSSVVMADSAASEAGVTNVIPVSSSVTITNGATITLTEDTTTNVTVTATITDNNGCQDIDSVTFKFFRTDVGAGAGDDPNNHYTTAGAQAGANTCDGPTDLTVGYSATFPVEYFVDPTDPGSVYASTNWSARVTPADGEGGTAGADATTEMATIVALNVTPTVPFGVMDLGQDTGSADMTTTITNTGNVGIGVQLDGYAIFSGDGYCLGCTNGSIPVANEKYSKTAATPYASKTALTASAVTLSGFSVAKATGGTHTTGLVYWGLKLPDSGVSGSCSGTIVLTALIP